MTFTRLNASAATLTKNRTEDSVSPFSGVTVSYFEWVQDLYAFFWAEAEVNQYLERTMTSAFKEVAAISDQYKVDMRTGAYVLAVSRVAEATRVRGIFP